jgi:hypothetical protein
MAMTTLERPCEEVSIFVSAKPPAIGMHWSLYFLSYAILLNVPYWFAARNLGLLLHGWFCLEFPIIGIVALYFPRVGAPVLIVFVMLADLVCSVCETYFIFPAELFNNLAGIRDFSFGRIVYVIMTGIMIIALALLARTFSISIPNLDGRKRAAICLLVFAVGCITADFWKGLAGTGQHPNLINGLNAADTLSVRHYRDVRASRLPLRWWIQDLWRAKADRIAKNGSRGKPEPVQSAFNEMTGITGIAADGEDSSRPNIVLIVVESWGLANDSAIRDKITEPLMRFTAAQHEPRYKVVEGSVPFNGATISGEGRELCATAIGLHIIEASSQELSSCLPERLNSSGYHTVAIHGMDGHLFNRRNWYPTIGFQEALFRSQLRALGLPDCVGAFIGTCDAAIVDWIGTRLETSSSPQFIYWMTLNSHLPVPNPPSLISPASCSFSSRLSGNPALCSWFQLEENVDRAVATLARTSSPGRKTIFVLVGDHAPPFSDPGLRASFSPTDVPYIALIPTQLANAAQHTQGKP